MATGFEIYDENGNVVFDSRDVTWNQVDYFQVSEDTDAYYTYSDLAGLEKLVVQSFINNPPSDQKAVQYSFAWDQNGTRLRVYGGTERAFILVLAR